MRHNNKEQDFWKKVDIKSEDECWNWKGSLTSKGYGQFFMGKIRYFVHVLSYRLHYTDYTPKLRVMHTCHNKLCCNPNHLKLGTDAENMQDTDRAKVTWDIVNFIRQDYKKGETRQQDYADIFNIGLKTVSDIILHKTWK